MKGIRSLDDVLARHSGGALVLFLVAIMLGGCTHEAPRIGTSRAPVVGGRPAGADEIYSTVALVSNDDLSQICTGTLIDPRTVLTAAHCVEIIDEYTWEHQGFAQPDSIAVSAGKLDLRDLSRPEVHAVASIRAHPNYNGVVEGGDADGLGRLNDIAVLSLERPITTVPSVRVLSMEQDDAHLDRGTEVVIEGYGLTNLVDDYQEPVLNIARTEYQRRSDFEFIAGRDGLPDTCNGDSGGPVYVELGGVRYVVGVTSRPTDTAVELCGEGGIYTLASAYIDWIGTSDAGSDGSDHDPDDGSDDQDENDDTNNEDLDDEDWDDEDWDDEDWYDDGWEDEDRNPGRSANGRGCSVAGNGGAAGALPLLLGLMGIAFLRRRNRQSSSS